MKKKRFAIALAAILSSACILSVHADDSAVVTVPRQNSVGIVQSDDYSIYIDAEDIKNIRLAVNTNAQLLDDVRKTLGMTKSTYDPTILYEPGDCVFVHGKIYVCEHSTTGEFLEGDWIEYTLSEYLAYLDKNALQSAMDEISALAAAVSVPYHTSTSYQKDDIVMYEGSLYLLHDETDAGVPGESNGWQEISLSDVVSALMRRDNFSAVCEKQDGFFSEDGSDLYKVTFTKQQ